MQIFDFIVNAEIVMILVFKNIAISTKIVSRIYLYQMIIANAFCIESYITRITLLFSYKFIKMHKYAKIRFN